VLETIPETDEQTKSSDRTSDHSPTEKKRLKSNSFSQFSHMFMRSSSNAYGITTIAQCLLVDAQVKTRIYERVKIV